MSIFKRLYGRRIPQTKIPDVENPGTIEEKVTTVQGKSVEAAAATNATSTQAEAATTEQTTAANTESATTEKTSGVGATATATTGQSTAANETNTAPSPPTSNGAPRSFQFGTKAKIIRDMIAQHRFKLLNAASSGVNGSDQNQLTFVICILGLAILCSLASIGTTYWQCEGKQHYGLWNTCQKQMALTLPIDITANATDSTGNSTTISSEILCLHHNKLNQLELVAQTDHSRVDQVQASQGLIICGTVVYAISLVALVFALRYVKQKPVGNLNMMRNLLVAAIFSQLLAMLLHIIGFFMYILTERISISVGILFVYFGLGVLILPAINFVTIEYKAYKMRQQQVQLQN